MFFFSVGRSTVFQFDHAANGTNYLKFQSGMKHVIKLRCKVSKKTHHLECSPFSKEKFDFFNSQQLEAVSYSFYF